jgi:hypothetical protein
VIVAPSLHNVGGRSPIDLKIESQIPSNPTSDWAARNFILNILTFDLRKIASPRHSDLPERRIVDGLTVPAKTSANVPINSATHFFITLNKLLFVYPFCSPHRNDEMKPNGPIQLINLPARHCRLAQHAAWWGCLPLLRSA